MQPPTAAAAISAHTAASAVPEDQLAAAIEWTEAYLATLQARLHQQQGNPPDPEEEIPLFGIIH